MVIDIQSLLSTILSLISLLLIAVSIGVYKGRFDDLPCVKNKNYHQETSQAAAILNLQSEQLKQSCSRQELMDVRLDTLMTTVKVIETKNELFWRMLEPRLATMIHSPEHTRRDTLVEKLVSHSISDSEASELGDILSQAAVESSDAKALAAALLLIRTKLAAETK